jgi:hypothetical protein
MNNEFKTQMEIVVALRPFIEQATLTAVGLEPPLICAGWRSYRLAVWRCGRQTLPVTLSASSCARGI